MIGRLILVAELICIRINWIAGISACYWNGEISIGKMTLMILMVVWIAAHHHERKVLRVGLEAIMRVDTQCG